MRCLSTDLTRPSGAPLTSRRFIIASAAVIAATLVLSLTQAPLGGPVFYAVAATLTIAYTAMLAGVWNAPTNRRLMLAAFAVAVLCRVPLVLGPVGTDSDMMRYIWDGRVQRFGYNPYHVRPADPALAHTHTDDTRAMPSRRARTPYPPASQLFFRLMVTLHDSPRTMRLVLVACDILIILIVWRWLALTGRNPWRALAYAWNPLVILEVAHSGHIDALGALWIAASAYWLARRRTALASVAFVLSIATKLLPIVLLPLFWRRVRLRDAALGGVVLAGLYLPYAGGPELPVGAMPSVISGTRFNGPAFMAIRLATHPVFATAVAVLAGLAVALWARARLSRTDPAAWAWPMAASLTFAPVVYPWYLLYFTPFLLTMETLPLVAWTFTVLPAYLVWYIDAWRQPWIVPPTVLLVEYGVLAGAIALMLWRRRTVEVASTAETEHSRASV
jgi:alpha-1,6-mannosyltransferase